jgi:diguanylate cyclase (GGDEF)-like protein/PAS domain S-box-containing protein
MKASLTEGARTSDWAKQGITADLDQGELFERAFRHAAIGMALVDLDGRFLKVNEALCKTMGYAKAELMALDFRTITHPADVDADLEQVQRLLAGKLESYQLEKRYLHKDGRELWSVLSVTLARSASGVARFFIAQIQDVTARKHAESSMTEFFAASPDLLAIANTSGLLELVNPTWQAKLGWSSEELTSRPFLDFVHPDDRERTQREAEAVSRGRPTAGFRNRYLAKDGSYRALEWNARLAGSGKLYCVARDVSQRDQAERELRHTKLLLEATIANIEDGVVLLDAERNVILFNHAYAALFGLDAGTLRGMSRTQFLRHVGGLAEDPVSFERDFSRISLDTQANVALFTLLRPTRRVLRRSARPLGSEGERLYLIVWHDVTVEHDRARDQELAAHTDPLTGLPNRRAADEALPREVSRAERSAGNLCAVMMDIDHFKRVNDSFGHPVGDNVLRHIATAIQSQTRSADLVARWGGEEFVALLASDRAGALLFAERARAAVEALELPQVGRVTISAGIGEYARGGSGSADQLLADADARLYEAKAQGRNRVLG